MDKEETNKKLLDLRPLQHYDWGTAYNDFVIVDGLQRLTAVLLFMDNKLTVFKELGGYGVNQIGVNQINPVFKRGIGLVFHHTCLKTKQEVLKFYLQLNEGGVVHTDEELEKVRKMLKELEK